MAKLCIKIEVALDEDVLMVRTTNNWEEAEMNLDSLRREYEKQQLIAEEEAIRLEELDKDKNE